MERENNNMEATRYEALIAAYLSGNITAVEKAHLMQWVAESEPNRKFFEQMVDLWGAAADDNSEPWPTSTEVAWHRLEEKLFPAADVLQPSHAKIRPLNYRSVWLRRLAIAASLALVLVAGWQWQQQAQASQWTTVTTAANERKPIRLPDGTQVWLNAASSLRYQTDFEVRTLELTGEAFFDVATDSLRPFQVLSGDALVTVLGTSFNLRAYPDEPEVEVSVQEGKVALAQRATPARQIELSAGKAGRYDKPSQQLNVDDEVADNTLAWKDRRLDFENAPMTEIAEAIQRYYKVQVVLENPQLGACRFTGEYEDVSLDDLLAILSASMELQLEAIDAGQVRISGEGCK